MESSHYLLKTLGLESYINNDPLPRVEMDNFELDSKTKSDDPTTREPINDKVTQITSKIQADDFFSSLELQSSSKTSSNMIGLGFSNKVTGGIVTRSRSFLSTLHEPAKPSENVAAKPKAKGRAKRDVKKQSNEKFFVKRKIQSRGKCRKLKTKKTERKDKALVLGDAKKQNSNKIEENLVEKSLGFEKCKDDDEWILFNNLTLKKEIDDKMFENKPTLSNELQNPVRRCTPELFSMNSILMSDGMSEGKDEVDNLLEVEDYDDSFLEEMEDFNYAPPRSHTGGKWKPESLTIRTSPMLWQNQNWDSFLDEEKRNRSETPVDSPTDSNKFSVSGKSFTPPNTHTGGKWKPHPYPPATHTGGKWKPITPPATHTGGKWKPDFANRPKKSDQDLMSQVDGANWKYDREREMEPPPSHTGGKWKPSSGHTAELWKDESSKIGMEAPESSLKQGKWESDTSDKTTLDVLVSCQNASGKCLKTSGGLIQYYCSPCNRRLSSKKMYNKHVQSELHFKRVLQENELEFDSRSLKLFRGLFTQSGYKERGLGKRVIKKPEIFKNSEVRKEKKIPTLVKIRGKRIARREIIRCEVCKVKIPSSQLGKHLVSYYHSRRIQLNNPEQRKLILDNIHAIVKQAPYQCCTCKFYCNTHTLFKKHWALPVHKQMEETRKRFWCALCSFECETSRSMELHLDSNSHREVILAINKSIPIIIRHKVIFNCSVCFKEFRFNRELNRHKQIAHGLKDDKISKFVCPVCHNNRKSIKSLQRHIKSLHRNEKVPYFCNTCNEFFNTAAQAKIHRNSQFHKCKKLLSESRNSEKVSLARTCTYCEETLENITRLKAHLLEKHSEFLPKCIKCGMVFALSQEVSKHVKNNECNFSQTKQNPFSEFSCENCPFSTDVKSEFLLHSAVHQKKPKNGKKISCPLCGSSFTQASLSIHLRTHLKEKTYRCSVCFKGFVRKDRYLSHVKMKHGARDDFEVSDGSEMKPGENKNVTDEENKNKMEENENVQESGNLEKKTFERRQICGDPKCRYVAKNLTDLENHSIFHIGPKKYQCPECSYSAKTNANIKRHYMTHGDERSFPCHLCSFKARLKSHLKRHMRLHTGAKPYKCPHCSYTCNILENLRKHALNSNIHPGKKLYGCKLCTFSTNVSKDFKNHLFESHKNEYSSLDPNEVAGIYNREEDSKNASKCMPVKPRASAKTSKRVYSDAFMKKVDLITQKFSPIAPKPMSANCPQSPSRNTGNSVEDKRKILKMELEKLKNQIKPSPKSPRSYPSPMEKEHKIKSNSECVQNDVTGKKSPIKKSPPDTNLCSGSQTDGENGVVFLNVMPAVISLSEDPPSKNAVVENPLQQMELSSACILYENVLPSEEMGLYFLGNYQV